jgi:hypothetical protein
VAQHAALDSEQQHGDTDCEQESAPHGSGSQEKIGPVADIDLTAASTGASCQQYRRYGLRIPVTVAAIIRAEEKLAICAVDMFSIAVL